MSSEREHSTYDGSPLDGPQIGRHGLLRDPALYLNRELSWLDFNERVLQLAEDERVPLLERVKFCAIYTTNLDEFYMVRVAGLRDQIDAGVENPSQENSSLGDQEPARFQQQANIQAGQSLLDRRRIFFDLGGRIEAGR